MINKYSNNSIVRILSTEERLYLYEIKEFLKYTILSSTCIFLDNKFKTKYVCDKGLSLQERRLDVEDVVRLIKEKQIAVEEVYELENTEEQIEDFKIELKRLNDLYWK